MTKVRKSNTLELEEPRDLIFYVFCEKGTTELYIKMTDCIGCEYYSENRTNGKIQCSY